MTGGRPDDHAQIPSALPAMTRLIADLMLSDPDDRDHVWALACLATWQEWDASARNFATFEGDTRQPAWIILTGGPPMAPGLSAIQETVGTGGYVAQVLRRFPNDSRFLLAQAEGHEAVQTLCADQFCFDEITPAVLADLRQRAKSGPPDRPGFEYTFLRRIHDTAIVNLAGFDRLVPVAAEFAALAAAHPEVGSEANVHIGYLAIRAARPDAALAPLAIAATSDDPYVHYLAEQFTGLALETLGRAEDAIAAYRRALAIVPNAPSAATLLAAQLFVSDGVAEREEAFTLLQAANSASPAPVDPRDLYLARGRAALECLHAGPTGGTPAMRPALLAATFVASGAFALLQDGSQVFRSGVQTVFVEVSVLRGHAQLAGLGAADFILSDNGARQGIESLDSAAIPLDVSLVVDATWFTQGLAGGMGPARYGCPAPQCPTGRPTAASSGSPRRDHVRR